MVSIVSVVFLYMPYISKIICNKIVCFFFIKTLVFVEREGMIHVKYLGAVRVGTKMIVPTEISLALVRRIILTERN